MCEAQHAVALRSVQSIADATERNLDASLLARHELVEAAMVGDRLAWGLSERRIAHCFGQDAVLQQQMQVAEIAAKETATLVQRAGLAVEQATSLYKAAEQLALQRDIKMQQAASDDRHAARLHWMAARERSEAA